MFWRWGSSPPSSCFEDDSQEAWACPCHPRLHRGFPWPRPADSAEPGFRALSGRWLRPDGGYILDIRDVDASGKIEAEYLNPRPITVARAEATRDGSTLKVFVELRAPGYPGSTYTLTYDPTRDQLAGIYFQAALQQRFDVVFVKMK